MRSMYYPLPWNLRPKPPRATTHKHTYPLPCSMYYDPQPSKPSTLNPQPFRIMIHMHMHTHPFPRSMYYDPDFYVLSGSKANVW